MLTWPLHLEPNIHKTYTKNYILMIYIFVQLSQNMLGFPVYILNNPLFSPTASQFRCRRVSNRRVMNMKSL